MVIDIYFADAAARAAALSIMLRKFDSVSSADDDIARIAKAAHGFSAADLQSLCLRTFMEHRYKTTADDLVHMVSEVKPSNLSSFQSKIPPVRFADMFGIDDTISLVRSVVIEPLMNAEKYHEMQVEPPRGALIYGPPGTGKSMLCCAVANELSVNAIWVDSTQLRSMVVGESEKAIADLFAQARKSAPCILLFDNIDTLAPKRGTSQTSENTSDRIVTSLLVVTNRPHVVDPALLRPGRLDVKGRKAILSGYMRKSPATAKIYTNGTFVDKLVSMTRGYSGAELANLCREAAMTALRRDIESVEVTEADFEQCLEADLR
ncbi:hypothetical protein FB639_000794 [Coemansia asiatica]|nr:hypothetical protein FB639_000794 [Coemansia asiatica]